MAHILKCEVCGSYGLSEKCSCDGKRVIVRPAKYSLDDKYAKYRRRAREAHDVENHDS